MSRVDRNKPYFEECATWLVMWVPFRDPVGSNNNKSCLYVKADEVKYRGGQAKKSDPCLAILQPWNGHCGHVLLSLLAKADRPMARKDFQGREYWGGGNGRRRCHDGRVY